MLNPIVAGKTASLLMVSVPVAIHYGRLTTTVHLFLFLSFVFRQTNNNRRRTEIRQGKGLTTEQAKKKLKKWLN